MTSDASWHRIFIKFPFREQPDEIPVLPEHIAGREEQIIRVHELISIGEVAALGGAKLRRYRWESHFPLIYDPSIEIVPESAHREPSMWMQQITRCQRRGLKVQLTITNTDIDMYCAIDAFDYTYTYGPPGDLWYQISLTEFREGFIREFNGVEFPHLDVRPPPVDERPLVYVSKPGQSLQDISLILYGSDAYWVDLYEQNLENILGPFVYDPGFIDQSFDEHFWSLWGASDQLKSGTVLNVPNLVTIQNLDRPVP